MSESQSPKPNLDLIQMVQQARMMHDRAATPSAFSAVYWIESKPLTAYPAPTAQAGEWVIETTVAEVDVLWAAVRAATEAGQLGYKSKVSTVPAKHQANVNARLIVVRTVDADDAVDVARVGEALRTLGVGVMRYERA